MNFIIETNLEYDYKFTIWMRTHNTLINPINFEVNLVVGCGPNSIAFTYFNILGEFPGKPF
jgi:hypothetical protein